MRAAGLSAAEELAEAVAVRRVSAEAAVSGTARRVRNTAAVTALMIARNAFSRIISVSSRFG
jgi:hypothetical protein